MVSTRNSEVVGVYSGCVSAKQSCRGVVSVEELQIWKCKSSKKAGAFVFFFLVSGDGRKCDVAVRFAGARVLGTEVSEGWTPPKLWRGAGVVGLSTVGDASSLQH